MPEALTALIADVHRQVTFASPYFVMVFVPVACLAVAFARLAGGGIAATFALIAVSLLFYVSWGTASLLVLAASIGANYSLRRFLIRANEAGHAARARHLLVLTVALNLGVLAYFKYEGFLVSALSGSLESAPPSPWLPLGLSFFTFQEITLAVDAYRGRYNKSFLRYVAFITFFPHLVAGPLLHHSELIPQMRRVGVRAQNVALGLTIFAAGLFKKVCFADPLAPFVARVFDSAAAPGFADAWLGALAYGMQLYFDFSGYSDMAIGLGLLFNIRLPVNFFSPYKSESIIEFWRRWHMTLSRFLREYVYYPLGGNRKGAARRYANILIVMLVGGLWHGANWTFVAWGGLHGLFLLVNHAWQRVRSPFVAVGGEPGAYRVAARALTFACAIFAWVPFRAHDMHRAGEMWSAMLRWPAAPSATWPEFPFAIALLGVVVAFTQLAPNTAELMLAGRGKVFGYPRAPRGWTWAPSAASACLAGLLLAIALAMSLQGAPIFLYWNF